MTARRTGWLARLWQRDAPPPAPEPAAPPAIAPLAPASDALAWYRLGPMQGGRLCVGPGNARRLYVAASAAADASAMFAIIPAALPHLCLLLAPDGAAVVLPGDDEGAGIAVSLRSLPTDLPGHVRLRHPLGERAFLTAADPPPDGGPATVELDGPGTTHQAVFVLAPVALSEVPTPLHGIAAEIGAACAGRLAAAALLADLEAGRLRPALAGAMLRAMPRDELADLARRLLEQPAIIPRLSQAVPHDPWLCDRLPALAAWNVSRAAVPDGISASPAQDEALILPTATHRPIPAGLALQVLARRQIMPRRLLCLLATARNEGPYLLDWISYHLSIGFEHIFLYSNDNRDGSDELLALLAHHGVITWIDNTRTANIGPQDKAYAHALTLLPQILDFRWTAILDLDEYLAFDTAMFSGVADFLALQEAQPVDAIALCWAFFVGLPGESWSDQPSTARFTKRRRDINKHVKSLFRTRQFWHAQPHYPYSTFGAPFDYRTQDGTFHHHAAVQDRIPAFAERPAANQAWINHYMLRTAPEAVWKWSRGRASWLREGSDRREFMAFIASTFLDFARPEILVEDRRILACARAQAAQLQKLRRLPGVTAAEADIQARFAAQIRGAADEFLQAAAAEDVARPVRHFRAILAAARAQM